MNATTTATTTTPPTLTRPQKSDREALRELYAHQQKIFAQVATTAAQLDEIGAQLAAIIARLDQSEPARTAERPPSAAGFMAHSVIAESLSKPGQAPRTYYKIMGEAPYHQWGVRVWPEVLAQAGIDPASVTESQPHTLPPGTMAYLQDEPKKVTAIVYPTHGR